MMILEVREILDVLQLIVNEEQWQNRELIPCSSKEEDSNFPSSTYWCVKPLMKLDVIKAHYGTFTTPMGQTIYSMEAGKSDERCFLAMSSLVPQIKR